MTITQRQLAVELGQIRGVLLTIAEAVETLLQANLPPEPGPRARRGRQDASCRTLLRLVRGDQDGTPGPLRPPPRR
jgi:hypothetical protein